MTLISRPIMNKLLLFIPGILLLAALEVAKVYFIMPFPGSQESETITPAYWIHQNIFWLRIVGGMLLLWPTYRLLAERGPKLRKALVLVLLAGYGAVFYLFNFQFLAEKIFHQPRTVRLAPMKANKIPGHKLVLGLLLNGQARAYPIQLIGYHHQVRDTVGGEPVMITYCTVCRTGRVFRPLVNGRPETFRLVGMDHFNAMFEDRTTGSWWRQVNGEAVVGPLKGQTLPDLPAEHMTLAAWAEQHPETLVLQPDTTFNKDYKGMDPFDKGKSKGELTRRDSLSWKRKSWVVGVVQNRAARAYDWNRLLDRKITNDRLGGRPLVLMVAADSASFHVWNREVDGRTLTFAPAGTDTFRDAETGSLWNRQGVCMEGELVGRKLTALSASQEFWHSWQTFHPETSRFEGAKTPPAHE
ncbi:DUF3179 domain-containing (seleno)protein [Larkinella soli]|uniref:DUF3179 domain-containing (seleno)protein n=1 Tax=Larkinella soli TaxID=1770527 RepID=UPI001E4B142D|nr:DUF3179 domain-containing (seleno)protein [Larkinella soli]